MTLIDCVKLKSTDDLMGLPLSLTAALIIIPTIPLAIYLSLPFSHPMRHPPRWLTHSSHLRLSNRTSPPLLLRPLFFHRTMKRKALDSGSSAKTKAKKILPEYCDVELRRDESGETVWPAPAKAMEAAREFLRGW